MWVYQFEDLKMNNFVKAIVISTAALSTQVMADVDTQAAFSNLNLKQFIRKPF